MEHHRRQAQELGQRLADTIAAYHQAEEANGTPMLLNDILSSVAHLMGSLIANLPEDQSSAIFSDLGQMVLMSITMHREAGGGVKIHVLDPEALQ
jgi:hypothetical protein